MEKFIETDSSLIDNEYFFPKRSHSISPNSNGKLQLAVNYYNFRFLNQTKKTFFQYSVQFEPELPGDAYRLRAKLVYSAKGTISNMLGNFLFNNSALYSLNDFSDTIQTSIELHSMTYKITIKDSKMIESNSLEAGSIYKKFLRNLLKNLQLIQFKKNFYNKNGARHFPSCKEIELWPGFNSSVNILQEGILLNMNLTYRFIRTETAFGAIEKLLEKNTKNPEEIQMNLNEYFKSISVLTRYNGDKIYIISHVDIKQSPKSTFDTKDGPISYLDYYKQKYGYKINMLDQPLLVHVDTRQNRTIHLIPELCYLTGLTEDMRANFNLMKEVSAVTKGTPGEKMQECKNLIDQFLNNSKCQKEMENWGLTISNQPLSLTGHRLTAGNYLMHLKQDGNRYSFGIDDNMEVDRKIQAEMYNQPGLNMWAVFGTQKDESLVRTFVDTMRQVQSTFNYKMNPPKIILVKSQQYRDWEEEMSKNLNPNVQAVVCIIPGSRGKGALYNDVKRLLMGKFPVPSQLVLSGTLAKGKGIRSIVNKVLIQICAKIGGEPWAVDQMPFTNCPTMVCGLDIFNKNGRQTILGFTATYNRTFTRYISIAKVVENYDTPKVLCECINEAIKNFVACNQISPKHIIIIRDGLSPSQIKTICIPEVNSVKVELQALGCKLTYALLNKKTNLKVFSVDKTSITNSQPGTIVDTKVTSSEFNDFYLIPAKSTQGLASCIHYQLIFDNAKVLESDFQLLIYKLCYLYYNWTGSIKVPAPCQYAKKLATLLGDKLSDNRGIFLPNSRFSQTLKSLFYL